MILGLHSALTTGCGVVMVKGNIDWTKTREEGTYIDIWWLYDDGGLTVLIPYLLQKAKEWENCQLRIMALENVGLQDQQELISLMAKLRIKAEVVNVKSDLPTRSISHIDRNALGFDVNIEPNTLKNVLRGAPISDDNDADRDGKGKDSGSESGHRGVTLGSDASLHGDDESHASLVLNDQHSQDNSDHEGEIHPSASATPDSKHILNKKSPHKSTHLDVDTNTRKRKSPKKKSPRTDSSGNNIVNSNRKQSLGMFDSTEDIENEIKNELGDSITLFAKKKLIKYKKLGKLIEQSRSSELCIVTMPFPRAEYTWFEYTKIIEALSPRDMPMVFVRGNQNQVLTFAL